MDTTDKHDKVWEDLLNVVDQNQKLFNAPQMVMIIAQFAAVMACDMAPSLDEADEVIKEAVDFIIDGYRKDALTH